MKIHLFKRKQKEIIDEHSSNKCTFILTFDEEGYRIEVRNNQGKSNLSLFIEGKRIFEGRYGELVELLTLTSKRKKK